MLWTEKKPQENFNKIKLLWDKINFKEPDIGEVECYFKLITTNIIYENPNIVYKVY